MHVRHVVFVSVFALLSCAPEDAERSQTARLQLSAPYLIDLNTTLGSNFSSNPGSFTRFGDAGVAFFATRRGVGRELFLTDGTAQGTRLVREINQSGGSSLSPPALSSVNGVLAFGATDGTREDLWISDGTAPGTRALTRDGGWRALPAVLPNGLYFVSGPASSGNAALFRLDPGATSPTRVASLTACFQVRHFSAGASRLAFVCQDSFGNNVSLWLSDGTAGGTQVIDPGLPGVGALAWRGDTLFYAAGTTLKRIDPGSTTPAIDTPLPTVTRKLLFAGNGLWVLGTASLERVENGTSVSVAATCNTADLVASPVPDEALLLPCFNATSVLRVRLDAGVEPIASQLSVPRRLLGLETRAAFRSGNALCTTDGTDAGPVCGGYEFDVDEFEAAEFDGRIFFEARFPVGLQFNPEVFSAPIGALDAGGLLVDVSPASSSSNPRALVPWRSGLALIASTTGAALGERVHVVDDAGVHVIDAGTPSSQFAFFGDRLYGTAAPSTEAIFRTAGRSTDVEFFPAVDTGELVATQSHVLAFGETSSPGVWELRAFSAADAGYDVAGTFTQWGPFSPCCFGVDGTAVAFPVRSPDGGMRLWRSDGTNPRAQRTLRQRGERVHVGHDPPRRHGVLHELRGPAPRHGTRWRPPRDLAVGLHLRDA